MGLFDRILKSSRQVGSAAHKKKKNKKDTSITFNIQKKGFVSGPPLSRPPPCKQAWSCNDPTSSVVKIGTVSNPGIQSELQTDPGSQRFITNPTEECSAGAAPTFPNGDGSQYGSTKEGNQIEASELTRDMKRELGSSTEDTTERMVFQNDSEKSEVHTKDYNEVTGASKLDNMGSSHTLDYVDKGQQSQRPKSAGLALRRVASEKKLCTNPRPKTAFVKRAVSERKLNDKDVLLDNFVHPDDGKTKSNEDMTLFKILASGEGSSSSIQGSAPHPAPKGRIPSLTTTRAYIAPVTSRSFRDNITVEDILSAAGRTEDSHAESGDSDSDDKKTKEKPKKHTPLMLNKFPKGDPRRKFYQRMKWKKKAPVCYDQYLPRRSSYSCHDKVLVAAGYDPKDLRPMKGSTPYNRELEAKKEEVKQDEIERKKAMRRRALTARRISLAFARNDPIDDEYCSNGEYIVHHKPILDYLKLVSKDPDGYIALRKKIAGGSTDPSLAAFWDVCQRGQNNKENMLVQAAYELGTKLNLPMFAKYEKEERIKNAQKAALKQTDPEASKRNLRYIHDLMKNISQGRGTSQKQKKAPKMEGFTEMELKRARAEIFARGLTTAQLVCARDAALRELGMEEASVRRWWDVNKHCLYLRPYKSENKVGSDNSDNEW